MTFNRANLHVALLMGAIIAWLPGCSPAAKRERIMSRADQYFQAGEYEKAKIEYMSAIRLDSRNADALRQIGIIWLEQGNPLAATQFLQRAKELSPKSLPVHLTLGNALSRLGASNEARKEACAALDMDVRNEDAILLLANTSSTLEQIADCEKRFEGVPDKNSCGFQLASAAIFGRKGDWNAAEKAIERALLLNPNSSISHLALANLSMWRNDPAKAEQEYKKASDLSSARSIERLEYAQFKLFKGSKEEAKALTREISNRAPDFIASRVLEARIAVGSNDLDEALKLLKGVLQQDSVNPEARVLRAQICLIKGDAKSAVRDLSQLDREVKNSVAIKYELSAAHLVDKNVPGAIAVLNQAIAIDPSNARVAMTFAELNLRAGNPQAAANAMLVLLKLKPDSTDAQTLLARAYAGLRRLDEAAELYRQQVKADPKKQSAYVMLGKIFAQQNKALEARAAFEKAQELAPGDQHITEQLIHVDLLAKDYERARKRVEEEVAKHRESAFANVMRGKIYAAEKDWDNAAKVLRGALRENPSLEDARALLVSVLYSAHQLAEANKEADQALSEKPEDVWVLMLSGLIATGLNDSAKAEKAYSRALAIQPDSALALNNLAGVYLRTPGQLDKAHELATKARGLHPSDPAIADTLGQILYQRRDYQKALALFEESVAKLPSDPEVLYHLGMTRYVMGEIDGAVSPLNEAAKSSAQFAGKSEIAKRIAVIAALKGTAKERKSAADWEVLATEQNADPLVFILAGDAYVAEGPVKKASECYEQALKLNPKLLLADVRLAKLCAGPLRQQEKALEYARDARKLSPSDPKIAGLLGNLLWQTKEFSHAYPLLQEAATVGDADAEDLWGFAWAAYGLGKQAEATQTMERLLKRFPQSKQAAAAALDLELIRAVAEAKAIGQDLSAKSELRLEKEQECVPALMVRAATQSASERTKEAVATYIQVLGIFPEFAPAQAELAGIYKEDPKRLAEAYELATKARKQMTDDPKLSKTLGELSYLRKEYSSAIRFYQESSNVKPLDAKSLYILGLCQRQVSKKSESLAILSQAIAAGLQEPLASDARRIVSEMEKQ